MSNRKLYWDACAWIALINQEPTRYAALKYVYDRAQRGEVELWTSTFTFAEVYKKNCGNGNSGTFGTAQEMDDKFHDVLTQDNIKLIVLDQPLGIKARRLLRENPGIRKPQDAIHLASALRWNLDELHTFDGCDLLGFDKKLRREDGELLSVCVPSEHEGMPLFQGSGAHEKAEQA